MGGGGKYAFGLRYYCYEAGVYVHISGVYGCENVSSTKILLTDKKIS